MAVPCEAGIFYQQREATHSSVGNRQESPISKIPKPVLDWAERKIIEKLGDGTNIKGLLVHIHRNTDTGIILTESGMVVSLPTIRAELVQRTGEPNV